MGRLPDERYAITVTLTERERALAMALLDRTGFDSSMQMLRFLLWSACEDWGLAPGPGDFERGRWGQFPGGSTVTAPKKSTTRRPRLGGKPPKPGTRHPWRQYQQPIEGSTMSTPKKKDERKAHPHHTTTQHHPHAKTAQPHCDNHKEYHPTCRACRDLQDPNAGLPAKLGSEDNPVDTSDEHALDDALGELLAGAVGGGPTEDQQDGSGPLGTDPDPSADPDLFAGGASGGAGASEGFADGGDAPDDALKGSDDGGGQSDEADGDDDAGGDDDGLGDGGGDTDAGDPAGDNDPAGSTSDTGTADGGE